MHDFFLRRLLLGGSLLMSACHSEPDPQSAGPPVRPAKPAATPAAPDSLRTPVAASRAFMRWYARNWVRLASIPVVPASLDQDSSNVYAMDPKGLQQYLAAWRTSGLVSTAFLDNEGMLIMSADSLMRAEPQNDGPPRGLDFDHIIGGQDPQGDLALLVRLTPVLVAADSARATVRFSPPPNQLLEGGPLELLLARYQGRWLVDSTRAAPAE